VCHELLGEKLDSTYFPNRVAGSNNKSQIGRHPIARTSVNLEIHMSHFEERLEALHPRNGNRFRSKGDETNPPTGAKLTNLLLLELLQKQREQLQHPNEHLQKLTEV